MDKDNLAFELNLIKSFLDFLFSYNDKQLLQGMALHINEEKD